MATAAAAAANPALFKYLAPAIASSSITSMVLAGLIERAAKAAFAGLAADSSGAGGAKSGTGAAATEVAGGKTDAAAASPGPSVFLAVVGAVEGGGSIGRQGFELNIRSAAASSYPLTAALALCHGSSSAYNTVKLGVDLELATHILYGGCIFQLLYEVGSNADDTDPLILVPDRKIIDPGLQASGRLLQLPAYASVKRV